MMQIFAQQTPGDVAPSSIATFGAVAVLNVLSASGGADVIRAIEICARLGLFGPDSFSNGMDSQQTNKVALILPLALYF